MGNRVGKSGAAQISQDQNSLPSYILSLILSMLTVCSTLFILDDALWRLLYNTTRRVDRWKRCTILGLYRDLFPSVLTVGVFTPLTIYVSKRNINKSNKMCRSAILVVFYNTSLLNLYPLSHCPICWTPNSVCMVLPSLGWTWYFVGFF